ncbi:hypothetical protein JTB14_016886 [Gonioctena quinquepunctata]|nr:hypothetical protein JTB14_016886 [Gonioctena quinquepunctata]
MRKVVLKAPDGGYGWFIVLAAGINGFIGVTLQSGFGLILVRIFEHLGLSAMEGSFIMNLNAGFGMLAGLVNGPLLNKFGCRKVGLVGAFFMTAGMFLLTFADNMTGFVLAYGLMASIGLAITRSTYVLAISTYFSEKRSKAFGISMTIAGLGPILLPYILDILVEYLDTKGAILILSGIHAHTFIAACLLQPVKFHMKKIIVEEDKGLLPKIEELDEDRSSGYGEDHEVISEIPKIHSNRFQRGRSNSYVPQSELIFRRKDSLSR